MSESKVNMKIPTSRKEGGVLAKLWRSILHETNRINALDYMVAKYVAKNDPTGDRTKVGKRKTKSSLVNNINAPDMTWKTFVDLLFNFMDVVNIDIHISLTHRNGEKTLHNIKFNDSEGEANGTDDKKTDTK